MKTFLDLLGKLLSLLNSLFNKNQKREQQIQSAQDKQKIDDEATRAAQNAASEDEKKRQENINKMRELISD